MFCLFSISANFLKGQVSPRTVAGDQSGERVCLCPVTWACPSSHPSTHTPGPGRRVQLEKANPDYPWVTAAHRKNPVACSDCDFRTGGGCNRVGTAPWLSWGSAETLNIHTPTQVHSRAKGRQQLISSTTRHGC